MKFIKDKLLSYTTKSVDLDVRGQVLGYEYKYGTEW